MLNDGACQKICENTRLTEEGTPKVLTNLIQDI